MLQMDSTPESSNGLRTFTPLQYMDTKAFYVYIQQKYQSLAPQCHILIEDLAIFAQDESGLSSRQTAVLINNISFLYNLFSIS